MAMLAAPRRKQKVINLRAKNNEWSNDTNKFGQRMLEKMGWSSGKGLGAKENGIVEHVVARYKNDDKGLGFEDKNDQWTKHEDDFNALLSNLSNAEGSQEKLHSGISLEVKSKKSKARVHYHKFTRGKDLTRYSDKDLANIFGKKSLKAEEKQEEPLQANVETSEQIFTEKGSMEDYFKSKLAKLKSKSKLLQDKNENEDENVDYAFKSFSGNSDEPADEKTKQSSFSFYKSAITQDINGSFVKSQGDDKESESVTKIKKKKKNKNKLSNHCEQDSDNITSKCDSNIRNISELIVSNTEVDTQLKNKSIKQNKEAEEITMKSKKKKYKKKFDDEDNKHILDTSHALSLTNEEDYLPKKKKKRKNKDKK